MVAASQLVVYIANPIQNISDSITDMRSAKEIITKIQTLLNEAPTTESGIENTPERFANLTVNHVSYGYDEDKLVLSDISFTLERGGRYLL